MNITAMYVWEEIVNFLVAKTDIIAWFSEERSMEEGEGLEFEVDWSTMENYFMVENVKVFESTGQIPFSEG